MNKLTRYNQILISILGTTAIVILLFAAGAWLVNVLTPRPNYDDKTLIVQDELDSLKTINLRNQIIALEDIHLFDTASNSFGLHRLG